MGNIIESVVGCDSMYGIAALAILFLGFSVLGLFVYKTIQLVLPHLYRTTCKICNIVTKYKDVHTKANVKDVSFETELHR